ncbi:MAG TPA: acyltransferase [Mycobacteriales bacterium]|nr:acyltransferase [Mycobacteriales bacterium]
MTSAPAARENRLAWVDGLRGAAALIVVVQHAAERVSPAFRSFSSSWVQLGQLGVMVFFLVSGLVVPVSLERAGTLRLFWMSRVLRLYPAYWLSLVGFLVVHRLGDHPYPPAFRLHKVRSWAGELTMLQAYLHIPNLQGVYWTLAFEMAFYFAISLLFLTKLLRHSVFLACGALGGAVALSVLGRATGHHVPLGVANIATMFVGTVLWRVRSGDVSERTGWRVYGLGFVACELVLIVQLAGKGVDTSTADATSLRPTAIAWLIAYGVVGGAFALRERLVVPRALVLAGLVSYSVYLMHPLVLDALGRAGGVVGTVVLALAITLSAATVSYVVVERPSVRVGRRWSRRVAARSTRPSASH